MRFTVPAWPELPPAAETRVDPLDDGSQIVAGTTNLGFDSWSPEAFQGDSSRLRPDNASLAWAVWHLDGMDAFSATSYRAAWLTISPLGFAASADGITYSPVSPRTQSSGGNWIQVVDELRLPAGTNYVKVIFPSQSDFWARQLSQVSYRRPVTQTLTSRTISYQYDGLQRLISAQENPGTTQTSAYDLAGNRTGVWVNGTQTQHLSYNAANQVTGWQYDAAGNLLNDGTQQYSYDALNRVLTVGTTSNQYNGDGTLVAQTANSITTRYTQDLAAPLSQILGDASTGSAQVAHTYIYGKPAERLYGQHGPTRTWYSTDALGSLRSTLNDAGVPQQTALYDAWGLPETASIAPFGFTGELQQGSDVWLRARWYGAERGSFGARDPYHGDAQTPYSLMPYQYAYSAPTLWTDASGACVEGDGDNMQRCQATLEEINAHGIMLASEDRWRLSDRTKVRNAIRDILHGTGWSQDAFRLAITGFGNYKVTMFHDTKPATGYVDPNQSDGVLKVHVGINTDDMLARYTVMHELAHVWDNALLNALSDGLVRITGGSNEYKLDFCKFPTHCNLRYDRSPYRHNV